MAGKYSLCSTCAKRQSDGLEFTNARVGRCFICRGLVRRIPSIELRVIRQIRLYDFKTFAVGMIIPQEVHEREDVLRSNLRIRGMRTIKSQLAMEVAEFVKKKTGKVVDRMHPELTVLVDLAGEKITATAKSLFIYGKYTKPRGVSQRRELCETCGGRGCGECRGGYVDEPSVEEILSKRLIKIFRSSKTKFTWIGSEDADSVVYPPGRPFVVEVKDPMVRKIPDSLSLTTGMGFVRIVNLKVLKEKPISVPSFVFKTRALIEPVDHIDEGALRRAKEIKGLTVEYRNNKGKIVNKKVYSIRIERDGSNLLAEIKLDGGLPVKKLVNGESTTPSLSGLLQIPLNCLRFDILRVWESRSLRARAGKWDHVRIVG